MKKIEWKQPAIDAVVAIGGGTIVKSFVIDKVAMIGNLFAKITFDLMGIDIKLLAAGIAAMVVYKTYMK